MEAQLRRYFLGLVGFGFVACWAAAGLETGALAVAACTAIVGGRSSSGGGRRRRGSAGSSPGGARLFARVRSRTKNR